MGGTERVLAHDAERDIQGSSNAEGVATGEQDPPRERGGGDRSEGGTKECERE